MIAEFELLAAIRPYLDGDGPRLPRGTDDDAAVVMVGDQEVVVAVDTMVDHIHVDRSWSSMADLGWKALAVNLSDLAAVAALPVAAVISLQRPDDLTRREAEDLYAGLREAADRYDCLLVGGDIVGAPRLAVSVTVLGRPAEEGVILRRDGAVPGELVAVVGDLGMAAAGLGLWREGAHDLLAAHPELAAAHRRPVPLLSVVPPLVVAGPGAGIDVSDGLGRDLGHIAAASGVRIELDPERLRAPRGVAAAAERLGVDPVDLVVGGGDDYALAVTVSPDRLPRLDAALAGTGLTARVVGETMEGSGVALGDRDVATLGWQHSDDDTRRAGE